MSTVAQRRHRLPAALLAVLALAATGCSSDDGGERSGSASGGGGSGEGLTVWIAEDVPERVTQIEAVFADYTEATGTDVELVAVAEDQLFTLLTSAAAADELPDLLGALPLPVVRTLSANELLNTDVPAQVVEELGADTFAAEALALTADGDTQLAVPSESWAQLLFYRADLFEAAGLEPPTSYDSILAAAEALDSEEVAGFVGATAPGDSFTEQTFEHVALGNGCELVDEEGEVQLDSPECVAAFDFYGTLVQDYSVPGAQDVDTVRASYFAGQAAMFIWSTFVLDEMAGLRERRPADLRRVRRRPGVPGHQHRRGRGHRGPGRRRARALRRGDLVGDDEHRRRRGLGRPHHVHAGRRVRAVARGGPRGQAAGPGGHGGQPHGVHGRLGRPPVGVDTQAPLSDFYSPEVLEALTAGPAQISRWAIPQGQGELLGATQGEQPVATAVNEVSTGTDAERPPRPPPRPSARCSEPRSGRRRRAPAGAGAVPAVGAPGGRGRGAAPPGARADNRAGLALITPTVVIVIAVVVLPILWTLSLAFQKVTLLNLRQTELVGDYTLENFVDVLTARGFADALVTTLVYSVAGTASAIALGLVAALALRAPFRGRGVVRASMLLPYVAPVVAATFVWSTMLSPQFGMINHWGTEYLGWDEPGRVPQLRATARCPSSGRRSRCRRRCSRSSPSRRGGRSRSRSCSSPPGSRRSPARWRRPPGSTARAPTQRFRYIVWPQLLPTVAVLSVLRFIWTFNNFDDIYLLTGGGAGTEVVAVRVFNYLTASADIGAAAAQALVLAVILAVLVGVYLTAFGRQEEQA